MTLRELIDALQELATQVPEDSEIVAYDGNGDHYDPSHNYIINNVELDGDEPVIYIL